MRKNTTTSHSNILPLDTLVDVVAIHKVTKKKFVKEMTLSEYYKLNDKKFTYQAYQLGFLNKDKL